MPFLFLNSLLCLYRKWLNSAGLCSKQMYRYANYKENHIFLKKFPRISLSTLNARFYASQYLNSSNTLYRACKLRIISRFCLKRLSVFKRNSFHLTFANTFYSICVKSSDTQYRANRLRLSNGA